LTSPPRHLSRPVLVVEDNADSRQMMCDFLQATGFPCVSVSDALAALIALQNHRPWLILPDLMMPDMDGAGFRDKQLRLEDPQLASIPVVILSAHPDHGSFQSRMGAVGSLKKPGDLDHLLALLHHLLTVVDAPT
jgi:CheY-like chemotaxis protein